MKQKKFTAEEKEELLKNPNILDVKNSHVIYTQEFKDLAINQKNKEYRQTRDIFRRAGIPEWVNIKGYAKTNIQRWQKQNERLEEPTRGRPKQKIKANKDLTREEMLAKIAYLEEENDFLKKLEALELKAQKKSMQ